MNDLPEWAETTTTIIGIILAFTVLLLLITWCVYMAICEIKTDKKRNEYIQNLNEHDKAVIAAYKAIKVYPKTFNGANKKCQ